MTAPSDATRYPRGAGPFPNPIPKHGENNPKPITVTDGPDTPSITFLDQKTRSPPSNSSRSLMSTLDSDDVGEFCHGDGVTRRPLR